MWPLRVLPVFSASTIGVWPRFYAHNQMFWRWLGRVTFVLLLGKVPACFLPLQKRRGIDGFLPMAQLNEQRARASGTAHLSYRCALCQTLAHIYGQSAQARHDKAVMAAAI